jgi:hypothetical protein
LAGACACWRLLCVCVHLSRAASVGHARLLSTRDEWMASDPNGWLTANIIYNGVGESLRNVVQNPALDLYIVTTKQARQTCAE